MSIISFGRRRWVNLRAGHSIYLIFALTFMNFILIFHRLLIERVDFLSEIFSSLWIFGLIFLIVYIPVAVLIGHWHRKTQVKVETELWLRQNPMLAKWFRVLIDIQIGKASEEEIDHLQKLIRDIEEVKYMPEKE